MAELIQFTYSSLATHSFSENELFDLLTKARQNNFSYGITGMLLYADESFFQVLEGTPDAVDSLFARIQQDSRHTRITEIIKEPIAQRDFGDWTMGYVELSAQDADTIMGANDFFTRGASFANILPGRAKKLLKAFKSGRWRNRLSDAQPTKDFPGDHALRMKSKGGRRVVDAPERSDYTFAYQPIVDAVARRIFSYEALMRGLCQEPATQVLKRVPAAEMHRFDEESRMHAIRLAAHLGLSEKVNLNFLPRSTETSTTVISSLLSAASENGLRSEQIVIEILEREVIRDYDAFYQVVNECRGAGVIFALDDFGSGYAGLNLLSEFQPNLIKLDMHLVREIHHKGPRQAIVRGIQQTCVDLGIDIIAEGVESANEYGWLKNEGIFLFQGNLIAQPVFESLTRTFSLPDK